MAVAGCRCERPTAATPPPPAAGVEETLTQYRRNLWHGDYKAAYALLCAESRAKHLYPRWSLFVSRTKAGAEYEMVMIDWFLESVEYGGDQMTAWAIFSDPHQPGTHRRIGLVLEQDPPRASFEWRIRFDLK